MRKRSSLMALFHALGLVLGAEAMSGEAEEPSWWKCPRVAGDLWALRPKFEKQGIEAAAGVTVVWQANHGGGISSHPRGRWTGSWDLELTLDTEGAGLWPGGQFLIYLEGSEGTGIDERHVGSLFGVNGDAYSTGGRHTQFSEWWYEHTLADGLLSVRIGKLDATRDLDTNAYANCEVTQFLNTALVNNPTVAFPDYGLGAQAVLRPGGGFYLTALAMDGEAEGWASGRETLLDGSPYWFVAGEAGLEFELPLAERELPGALRVGAWHDPLRHEVVGGEGRTSKGASGWYLSFDQLLYREAGEGEDAQGLGVFFRYGYAPDDYSEVEHFWSAGFSYRGPLPGRDDDVLGLGFAQGRLGGPARDDLRFADETVWECYYSLFLGRGATVTLDFQYIRHPGASTSSCIVPGIRFQLDL